TDVLHAEATGGIRTGSDDFPRLPTAEVEGRASLLPLGPVRLEARGRVSSWDDGSATNGQLKAVLAPVPGIGVFGALEAGSRPLATFEESGADTVPVLIATHGGG